MRALATLLCLLLSATSLAAQQVPFDMTPEAPAQAPAARPRQAAPAPSPLPPVIPAVRLPRPQPTPISPTPEAAPAAPAALPATPAAPAAPAAEPASAAKPAATEPPAAPGEFRRYILPTADFALPGEIARRSWSVYLTPEQAASGAKLQFGFQNAIFVAPEASRLRILINDVGVVDQAVNAPDGVVDISTALPADVLRPGANTIRFETDLRHRTDCTIQSTYDLWVDIDPEKTFFSFQNEDAALLRRLDDVRAIGLDAKAKTAFNIVVPGGDIGPASAPLIRLSESLALIANMPNQRIAVTQQSLPDSADGALTILVGPANELSRFVPQMPALASQEPTVSFLDLPGNGGRALLLSGPGWRDVETAIQRVVEPTDRPLAISRTEIANPAWREPAAPLLLSSASVPFSKLGVASQEFSGRRFRTEFTVGIPQDFYAQAYGEAQILLDAGYTKDVLPGSHLDVYVNDNIATTLPIGGGSDVLLERYPVRVAMRNFKPGTNTIAVEAVLQTAADEACLPGANAAGDKRFALFDSSSFEMPDFARVSQRPNLSATQGTGYPYTRSTTPVPLFLDRDGTESLSAASTLLARMSVAGGRPVKVDIEWSPSEAASRDALFVGPSQQIAAGILPHVGISDTIRTAWGQADVRIAPPTDSTSIDSWRDQVSPAVWRRPFAALSRWLREDFAIAPEALRLTPAPDVEFLPSPSVQLLVAQGLSPTDEKVWTVVTAPTGAALMAGVEALTTQQNWGELGGRVTTYEEGTESFKRIPAGAPTFVQTQPLSVGNLRLIVANWLSENVLSYAALLIAVSMLLGLTTTAITVVLGRRK